MKGLLQRLFSVHMLSLLAFPVFAQQADTQPWHYSIKLSPWTLHWNEDPEHAQVWLAGLERQNPQRAVQGVSVFNNSFGQPSLFLYPWGQVYRPVRSAEQAYVKWAAGLLYGYRGRYERKVPLNQNGFSPGLILGLGWDIHPRYQVQLNLLGASAVMLTLYAHLPP